MDINPMQALAEPSLTKLLSRAATCVDAAIRGRANPLSPPDSADFELQTSRGVFVTLNYEGDLAGCIGYTEPLWPVWEATERAARSAALDDHRFERLRRDQLSGVDVEVSVLSPLRDIQAETFEPGVDGLVIDRGSSRGLLLPQVATDHGLDREAFLEALCGKAFLDASDWRRPDVQLRAFRVQRISGALTDFLSTQEP